MVSSTDISSSSVLSNSMVHSQDDGKNAAPTHRTSQSTPLLPRRYSCSLSFTEAPALKISDLVVKIEFFLGASNFHSSQGVLSYAMKKWGVTQEKPYLTLREFEEYVKKSLRSSAPSEPLSWKITYCIFDRLDSIDTSIKVFSISSVIGKFYLEAAAPGWKWRFSKAGATTDKMNGAALKVLPLRFRFDPDLLTRFDPDPESDQPQCTLDTLIEM